jgi:predicted adenine nucleotide alpha hydrolase (AANH) superfamily ATPase
MYQEVPKEKPALLLHICCAPCSIHPLEIMQEDYRVTGIYYGPNIHPEVEYIVRLEEMERVAGEKSIELIRAEYDMPEWFRKMEGLEQEHEGGERCKACYRIRLEKTAEYAVERNIENFTTTLSVSPHKDAGEINRIGTEIAEKYNLNFLSVDFKKRDGFKRSMEAAKELGLYRQDYCGCVYSRRERDRKANR